MNIGLVGHVISRAQIRSEEMGVTEDMEMPVYMRLFVYVGFFPYTNVFFTIFDICRCTLRR